MQIQDFLEWEKDRFKENEYWWRFVRFDVLNYIVTSGESLTQLKRYYKSKKDKSYNYWLVIKNISLFFLKLLFIRNRNIFIIPDDKSSVNQLFDKIIERVDNRLIIYLPSVQHNQIFSDSLTKKEVSGIIFFLYEKLLKLVRKDTFFEFEKEEFKPLQEIIPEKDIEYFLRRKRVNKDRESYISWIISLLKPRSITFLSYYDPLKQILIKNSKNLNYRTFEIQHGHIYKGHYGYSFQKNLDKIPYKLLPDQILVWSRFYKDILCNLDYSGEISVVGDIYNTNSSTEGFFSKKDKGTKYLLLVNQYTKTQEMISFINNSNIPEDFKLFIKVHPRFKEEQISEIETGIQVENCVIIEDSRKVIEIVNDFDFVLGFYSTGLIESLYMNVPTFIIADESSTIRSNEYFSKIIEKRWMNIIKDISELNRSEQIPNHIIDPFQTETVEKIYQTKH